jgi:hypothetical protein
MGAFMVKRRQLGHEFGFGIGIARVSRYGADAWPVVR